MVVSGLALASFGLVRLVFNAGGIRAFGAAYVGVIGAAVSYSSIAAVLIAAVPSVLGARFIAQYRGSSNEARASHLFTALLLITAVLGTAATATFIAMGKPEGQPVLAVYVAVFAMYLVLKGTYFAFELQGRYARAELAGLVVFLGCFAVSCALGSRRLATMCTLLHPVTVVACGLWDHRRHWSYADALGELVRDAAGYGAFAVSTLANAMNGLASYHLLLVLASRLLDPVSTGYLAVLLSALSPFSLLPTAYGSAAFPEFARRFGGGDLGGMTRLMRKSTVVLQAAVIVAVMPFAIASTAVLRFLGLPPQEAIASTWGWMLLALSLNCVSAPSGHYLNATKHVHKHAALSLLTLALGTYAGVEAMGKVGIVGAGLMRFAIDGTMAWARIVLSEWTAQWMRGATAWLVGSHLLLLGIFAASMFHRSAILALGIWATASAVQIIFGRRHVHDA